MNGGDEDRYLGLLLDAGIAPGTSFNPDLRLAFIDAYSRCESLRCGFQHYWRAASDQAGGNAIADPGRPVVLTLAIAGGVVGDATIGDTRGDRQRLAQRDRWHGDHERAEGIRTSGRARQPRPQH